MNLPLIGPGYKGVSDKLNASRMVNLYLEPGGKSGEPQPALIGTPGLRDFTYTGTGVIRGMHVFNSVMYVVSGSSLYSVNSSGTLSASLGTLQTSSGRVVMSDNGLSPTGGDQLIIVDGTYKYIYSLTSPFYWETQTLPSSKSWECIGSNGTYFVALASGGTSGCAATSSDGVTWTAHDLSISGQWRSISWGAGVYCTVDNGPSNNAMTSPDGANWTTRTLPSSANWSGITFGNSTFCAVAYGSNSAATSANGITWAAQTLPSSANWVSVAWNGSVFCTVAAGSNSAATSPDGITWTARTLPANSTWSDIVWNGTVFCAISESGGNAATSPDGITWTSQTMPSSAWEAIAWNGECLCAITNNSTAVAVSRDDGVTWDNSTTFLPLGINSWRDIAWNGDMFCTVGYGTSVAALSPFGTYWDGTRLVGDNLAASTVAFIGGCFIADIGGGQWQVSDLYNGLRFMDINKSTADAAPDNLLAVFNNHGELWLLGQSTTEVWYQSGVGNPPFARVSGGVLDYGCLARYSVAKGSNTIFWLGTIKNNTQGEPMGVVMASGYTIRNITPPAIIAQWRSYTTLTDAWGYCYSEDGHDFYVITFPTDNATWAYDITTDSWSERSYYTGSAYSPGRHLANTYAYFDSKHYVGSYLNGKIYEMSKAYHDDAGQPIDSFRTFQYVRDHGSLNNVVFNKFEVSLEVGQAQAGGICAISSAYQKADFSANNGANWAGSNIAIDVTAFSAIETNGYLYCAMSSNGSNKVATSLTGSNWTVGAMPSVADWKLLKWNGSVFCSVANGSNKAATSPDGITWTERTLPANSAWGALAWDGTKYLLYPLTVSSAYYTSPDGVNWSNQAYSGSSFSIVGRMVWNGSMFCTIGTEGTTYYPYVSTDGANWTRGTFPANFSSAGLAWNGSVFCTVKTNSNQAFISANGLSWTAASLPSNESWNHVVWNGQVFCAVSIATPNTYAAATSPDGITWTGVSPNNYAFSSLASWEDRMIAPNSVYLSWSDDGGNTWTSDKEVSLGTYGDYTKRAVWRRLGLARQRIFRLRYSAAKSKVIVSGNLDAKACAH